MLSKTNRLIPLETLFPFRRTVPLKIRGFTFLIEFSFLIEFFYEPSVKNNSHVREKPVLRNWRSSKTFAGEPSGRKEADPA